MEADVIESNASKLTQGPPLRLLTTETSIQRDWFRCQLGIRTSAGRSKELRKGPGDYFFGHNWQ